MYMYMCMCMCMCMYALYRKFRAHCTDRPLGRTTHADTFSLTHTGQNKPSPRREQPQLVLYHCSEPCPRLRLSSKVSKSPFMYLCVRVVSRPSTVWRHAPCVCAVWLGSHGGATHHARACRIYAVSLTRIVAPQAMRMRRIAVSLVPAPPCSAPRHGARICLGPTPPHAAEQHTPIPLVLLPFTHTANPFPDTQSSTHPREDQRDVCRC